MKDNMKKIISFIIIICLSVVYILPTQSVYASTSGKEIKAYKKFLKKKSYMVNSVSYDMSKSSFVVKDINDDGTKELIIFPNTDEMCTFVLYTYYKGKVKYVLSADHSEIGYYNKKSVFISKWTSMGIVTTHYYVYKKGKIKEIASFSDYKYFDESMDNHYEISGKEVTQKKFYKKLKSKHKISKSKKYKMITGKKRHIVTKSNIKKYVK